LGSVLYYVDTRRLSLRIQFIFLLSAFTFKNTDHSCYKPLPKGKEKKVVLRIE